MNLLLSQYSRDVIQRASQLNHYASDVCLASDDLIRPFKALESARTELEKLQHDAVFNAKLRPKIVELEAKVAANEKTLDRLEKECAAQGMTDRFSLWGMREKLRFIAEQIEIETGRYNDRCRSFREAAATLGDISFADKNPVVTAAKQDCDSKCADLRKEYSKISDNIETLENILRAFVW
jgi:uncharacterized coiled-coil protein SlyX